MHRKSESESTESTTKHEPAEVAAGALAAQAQGAHGEPELDFESLDLSIETVEERISPSETNVFDK